MSSQQPPIERSWDAPNQQPKKPTSNVMKWIFIGVFVIGVVVTAVVTFLPKSNLTGVTSCTPMSAADIEQFNYTFDLYERGESITSGSKSKVNLDGPGTLPISMLYAVTIAPSGKVGLFGALTGADGSQLEAGLPLNDVAQRSWPDARATDGVSAVDAAAESQDAATVIACLK